MTDNAKSYGYALLTVGFWSTVATAFKIALEHLDLFQLLFLATITSASVLLIPVLWQGNMRMLIAETKRHPLRSVSTAALNPFIYYLVLFAAYDRLPAQVAQPVNYTWALMLVLLSIVVLKQRPKVTDLIACVVSYGGVVVIATQGEFGLSGTDPLGLVLALGSTVLWASYWILNITDPRDERVAMCINFLLAVPITGAACFVFSDLDVGVTGLYAAAYVGVFEMGLAFLFWSRALKLAENTSRVSTLIFLSPFVSLVLIQTVLGEQIQTTTFIGLVIIIAGLMIQRLPLMRSA